MAKIYTGLYKALRPEKAKQEIQLFLLVHSLGFIPKSVININRDREMNMIRTSNHKFSKLATN